MVTRIPIITRHCMGRARHEGGLMAEITGICGLHCNECGALIATRDNDDAMRAKIAAEWSKLHDANLTAEMINCTGCTSDGEVKLGHCTVCAVRLCGVKRGVTTCAECDDYGCETLEEFLKMAPTLREGLEARRKGK